MRDMEVMSATTNLIIVNPFQPAITDSRDWEVTCVACKEDRSIQGIIVKKLLHIHSFVSYCLVDTIVIIK